MDYLAGVGDEELDEAPHGVLPGEHAQPRHAESASGALRTLHTELADAVGMLSTQRDGSDSRQSALGQGGRDAETPSRLLYPTTAGDLRAPQSQDAALNHQVQPPFPTRESTACLAATSLVPHHERTTESQLPTADCRLPTTDYRLPEPTTKSRLPRA